MAENELTGSYALVTGASRGIGRAVAVALAGSGAKIAVHYHRDAAAAESTKEQLAGDGHVTLQADCGDAVAAAALIDATVAEMGGLDILVGNAGIYEPHPPTTTDATHIPMAGHLVLDGPPGDGRGVAISVRP